jgi:hypothetical protein
VAIELAMIDVDGMGTTQMGSGAIDMRAPPTFLFSKDYQTNSSSQIQSSKWCSSRHPKFTKISKVTDEIKGNNFPFGSNFKIETNVELQIQKRSRI